MPRLVLIVIFIGFLNACQNLPGNSFQPLEKLLEKKGVIGTGIIQNEHGLIFVPVNFDNKNGFFLIDTGATQSATFKGSQLDLLEDRELSGSANIFGLVEQGNFPLVSIDGLSISNHNIPELDFVVLPERDNEIIPEGINDVDGLFGMDLLGNFNLLVDTPNQRLFLIPTKLAQPDIIETWVPVKLKHNPNSEFGQELNFFDLRVGNHIVPALFDTGSEFNVINWQATEIPALKRLKKRLREEWTIQGATGTFDPAVRIDVTALRAGRMRWTPKEFIVMDFDHLDGIGFKDKPLVIAGSPLFNGNRFYIDFKRQFVWFEPSPEQ